MLSGHGGGASGGPGPFVATRFGGRSAKDVVALLRDANLPKEYAGTIYLSACHSAAGFETGESFAEVVRDLLHKAGYKRLSVAGTAGVANTTVDGEKEARPAVYEKDLDDTIEKVERLVDKLGSDLEEYTKENSKLIAELNAKVSLAESEYRSCVDLVSSTELPPEALAVLERTLLQPLKTVYDSLKAELEVHENHTQALTRAEASERALLEKLKRIKAAPDDDAMKEAIRDEGLKVKEWWGVFGPKNDEDTRRAKKGFQVLDTLASGVGKLREKLKSKKS